MERVCCSPRCARVIFWGTSRFWANLASLWSRWGPKSRGLRPVERGLFCLGLVHWFLARRPGFGTTRKSLRLRYDGYKRWATLVSGSSSCNNLWRHPYSHIFGKETGRSFCQSSRCRRFSLGIPRSSFLCWSFQSLLHYSTILRTRETNFCRGSIPRACGRY